MISLVTASEKERAQATNLSHYSVWLKDVVFFPWSHFPEDLEEISWNGVAKRVTLPYFRSFYETIRPWREGGNPFVKRVMLLESAA